MTVDLLGIGKPCHSRIAKCLATELDNALIAAILAALINGEGNISAAKQHRHTGRHASHHIRTDLRFAVLVKGGIAAKRPVRCHIGKKGFHKAVALGLEREDPVKLHEGRQAGCNRQRLGLQTCDSIGIAVTLENARHRPADRRHAATDQRAVASFTGKIERQDLGTGSGRIIHSHITLRNRHLGVSSEWRLTP